MYKLAIMSKNENALTDFLVTSHERYINPRVIVKT